MQISITIRLLGRFLNRKISSDVSARARSAIQKEYLSIYSSEPDIGSKNRLLMSYALASYFIAMNHNSGLSADECIDILEDKLKHSRLYKAVMGNAESYFSEKNMISRRAWSRETHSEEHRKKYPNDWVVDVLEKTPEYEFGFDYTECGVVKLCRDQGCPELAKYLCRLDFMTAELMGIGLRRTMTLAEGGEKCDFRWLRK